MCQVREWARALPPGGPSEKSVLRSPFQVVDLPTPSALAATRSAWEIDSLPRGVRFRFLASGVEFVDEFEEERVKVSKNTSAKMHTVSADIETIIHP